METFQDATMRLEWGLAADRRVKTVGLRAPLWELVKAMAKLWSNWGTREIVKQAFRHRTRRRQK